MRRLLIVSGVLLTMLGTALVADAAPSDAGVNARLIRWQHEDATVHIFVYDDVGRLGTTAYVPEGRPLLFGFEFVGEDLTELEDYVDTLTMWVSIDGGPAIDVSSSFRTPFFSDGKGPRWTWDHDADGKGDADSDGIGDFPAGFIVPFRYVHRGLPAGPHTFAFSLDFNDGSPTFDDLVEFEMLP